MCIRDSICANEPFNMKIKMPARGKIGGFKCINPNAATAATEAKAEPAKVGLEEKAEVAELFLLVSMDKADEVQSHFGEENKFENVVDNKGYLRMQVELSQSFFSWLFVCQGKVKIEAPGNDIWNKTGSWRNLSTASRNARELRLDYEKAVGMYKEMLCNAQDAIG